MKGTVATSHHPALGDPRSGLPARDRVQRGVQPGWRVVAALAVALLAAGCASTQLGAQWVDLQMPKRSLQGATVLIVCEAQDTTVKLLCESRFADRLAALGVKALTSPALADASLAAGAADSAARLAAAKAAGARAVLQTTLRPDYAAVSAAPSFSIGIGGFGASGGGGVGGGVGVAVPVGGASGGAGMAASSSLLDAGSAKIVWSAQASAPSGSDASLQIDELAGVLAGALSQAGIF